jgi:type IV pilus assembly protein PilM
MLAENNFTAKKVRLSLPAQNSFQRLGKLPSIVGAKSSVSKIVEFEARQNVPYSMDEVEWDYQLIHHKWEETRDETQEDGTITSVTEQLEEYEALFVAMKSEQITEYTEVIEDSGKTVLSVEIAPEALFNVAKAAAVGPEECVVILNIGAKASSLIIADHNRIFLRSIPIAGSTITAQISKEFGVGLEEAEELKKRHGFVALGGAYEEPESEVASTISKIARNVMTRLHGEVSRSINVWRAQHNGSAPTKMFLAGGGSVMVYTPEFFNEKLHIEVQYLNTFSTIVIPETVNKNELQAVAPMFQELIGVALRSLVRCPLEINLLPRVIKKQVELDHKKPFFYVAVGLLLACLFLFVYGVSSQLDIYKDRVKKGKKDVSFYENKYNEVRSLKGQTDSAKGRYEEANAFLKSRSRWFDIINEIQSKMPNNMWVTIIEGVGDVKQEQAANSGPQDVGLFGGPAEGTSQKAAPKAKAADLTGLKRFEQVANTHEIKKIRLKGHTLIINGEEGLEKVFQDSLANSQYFESCVIEDRTKSDKVNMTSFELTINLKEPVRK